MVVRVIEAKEDKVTMADLIAGLKIHHHHIQHILEENQ